MDLGRNGRTSHSSRSGADGSDSTKRAPVVAPMLAGGLSAILPGLGQLYNGERAKGAALALTAASVIAGVVWTTVGPEASRSWVSAILLAPLYLFLWLPAILDAYQRAAGRSRTFLTAAGPWYVLVMLVALGPFALPLLWQSAAFSRAAKLGLTAAVIVIALLAVVFLATVGPYLEDRLPSRFGRLDSLVPLLIPELDGAEPVLR